MNREELIAYLSIDNSMGQKTRELTFKKYLPNEFLVITEYNEKYFPNNDFIWRQKLYNYIYNITIQPKCKNENCNNDVKFYNQLNKYLDFCCNKCISGSSLIKEKKIKTSLKNYGVPYTMQSKAIRDKSKETCLLKYGVDNPSKSKIILDKKIKTNLKKFGVTQYCYSDDFKKIMNTRHNNTTLNSFAKKLNISKENIEIIDDVYVKIKNYCPVHNEFIIKKDNVYGRTNVKIDNICTICYPINKNSSIKEIEIREFIENELGLKTKKIKIGTQEIDIYVESNRVGVEFNGIYWHSDKFKDIHYHSNKTNLSNEQNIHLIQIFENEWIMKNEIIESILMESLNIFDYNIDTNNKTNDILIKEIDDGLYLDFLENNHFLGKINSEIKIGLFCNDELVSIMSFNKIAGNNYELLRFSNKLNTIIIGGANKLLEYFISNYNPNEIITFVDRRYYNGKLYEELGFKIIENTEPNFYFVDRHTYISYNKHNINEFILSKQKPNENKTTDEIMKDLGYNKLYDCGDMKFVFKST